MKNAKIILFSIIMALVAQMSKADVEGRLLFGHQGVLGHLEPFEIAVAPYSAARFFKVPVSVEMGWKNKEQKVAAKISLSIRSIVVKQIEVLADGNLAVTIIPQYFEHHLFDTPKLVEVTRHIVVASDRSLNQFLTDVFAPTELKTFVREIFRARLNRAHCESLLI